MTVRQDLHLEQDGRASDRFEDEVESQLIQSPGTSSTALKRSNAGTTTTAPTSDESTMNNNVPPELVRKRIKRLRRKKGQEAEYHATIKYASLILLVAQMVGLVLLMRYSRTHKKSNEDLYLASTAVFVMEFMKFVICNLIVFFQVGASVRGLLSQLYTHIWQSPDEMLKLCVPSLLYTVQNNLLYLALTNLDAATYQVCYQLKILTTALFSVLMLKRTFSGQKWFSLFLLTIGVAIVQLSGDSKEGVRAQGENASRNRFIGLLSVFCATITSGFAGVYFEKILKGSSTSLWIRNIQMGLPSVLIALATVYLEDRDKVYSKGFFVGYNRIVWSVVTIQAVGGLIVAVVVKFADNVLKVFATSFSIVFSCIMSAFMSDFVPTFWFNVGASFVIISSVMYSKPDRGGVRTTLHRPILPTTVSTSVDPMTKRIS